MSTQVYPVHPYAEAFPLHEGQSLWDLRDDIDANGQKVPCVLWQDTDGKVWLCDGRRRVHACTTLAIEVKYIHFRGTEQEMMKHVISLNLKRRHLGESERAMVAGRLAKLTSGNPKLQDSSGNSNSANLPNCTQPKAAELLNVSTRSVGDARVVQEQGTAEEIQAVELGQASVSTTAQAIRQREKVPEDALGTPIPEKLLEIFKSSVCFQQAKKLINDASKLLADASKEKWGLHIHPDNLALEFRTIKEAIKFAKPHCVCPVCKADGKKPCQYCKKHGWLTLSHYNLLPTEYRE